MQRHDHGWSSCAPATALSSSSSSASCMEDDLEITKLRHAEEARDRSEAALKNSEERLSVALRSAPVLVFAHDGRLAVTWAFVDGKGQSTGLGDVLSVMPQT